MHIISELENQDNDLVMRYLSFNSLDISFGLVLDMEFGLR